MLTVLARQRILFIGIRILEHHRIVVMLRLDVRRVDVVELSEEPREDSPYSMEKCLFVSL